MDPLIEFRGATLGYGHKKIIAEISFAIHAGEYVGLVGPNGAGKTTILRTILGSLKPLAGDVRIGNPGERKLKFGYVPQRDTIDHILPYTVEQVVMMARYHQMGLVGRPQETDKDIVRRSLAAVGIEGLRDRWFKDLSGGQKQRALIARALASEPDVLTLDEPTNGMDLSSRIAILDLIQTLHAGGKLTVVMVSHLLDDVANYVKRIMLVEPGQFLVGTVEEILTGQNLTALYRMPVDVQRVHGNTVILAGGLHGRE
jgi:ABC-type Mn2+/Zn2+ transport system ATPase subunit